MMPTKAEYIWMDGGTPTARLRSKTRIIQGSVEQLDDLPEWTFDGSSTEQALGQVSDCGLKPVFFCRDPLRQDAVLVICEVFDADGNPHPTNTRAQLREAVEAHGHEEPWFGIEQEYTLLKGGRPLGWPEGGYPAPQGPFYCGVGADEVFGRRLVEEHLNTCLLAGLELSGINAEVMPGQWEFQVGPLGPLEVGDHLMAARFLLYRIGESRNVAVTLDPKPVRGEWNGAGAHTNFSTRAMREEGGLDVIYEAIPKLERRHDLHITHYGDGIERRLTGKHETCSYKEFRYGMGNRDASIRIPLQVKRDGKGYFEDRRPCANIDPYTVARIMIETVCG